MTKQTANTTAITLNGYAQGSEAGNQSQRYCCGVVKA
jgi:hypothetical protein